MKRHAWILVLVLVVCTVAWGRFYPIESPPIPKTTLVGPPIPVGPPEMPSSPAPVSPPDPVAAPAPVSGPEPISVPVMGGIPSWVGSFGWLNPPGTIGSPAPAVPPVPVSAPEPVGWNSLEPLGMQWFSGGDPVFEQWVGNLGIQLP